ncbi:MAG: PQQ-dependent sugar dehydrogenase, partial [Saprospiraceae bacterium]
MPRHLYYYILLLFTTTLSAANLPSGFVETLIADNLDPTKMALTPDGRIFIAQKDGRVFVVENDRLLPDPFLTIEVDNNNERGLSGIICHPNFANNGYFYLFYNVAGADKNRVSRFQAFGNTADPEEEEILLETDWLLSTVHNGGAMVFGQDGKLYISTGDGGQNQVAQDFNNTLGKVLRINDDGTIPTDNPFYNELEGKYRAIWARGFRNPFTMAVERGTGKIFLNDVGNGWYEEVNHVQKGKNYGWAITEGPLQSGQTAPPDYQSFFYGYNHIVGGCAIIGGTFYDAPMSNFPEKYRGMYYFGDYCENEIRMVDPVTGEYQGVFATDVKRPLAMLVAPDGSFYYLERGGERDGSQADNTSSTTARLFKVNYIGSGRPFISIQPNTQLTPVGESANLEVKVSGDAPFTYQWQRTGVDIAGATNSIFTINEVTIADNNAAFRVIVTNELGSDTSEVVRLQITENQRPTAEIQFIENTRTTYRAGDRLVFSATANDAEDGTIDKFNYTWRIDFYHDNHNHPALSPVSNTDRIEYIIPTTGETSEKVFFRVHFSVTDSEGLTRTVTRDILPELVDITVNSEPSGMLINVDGTTTTTPYTFTSVVGLRRAIQAVAVQFTDEEIIFFDNWTDGVEADIYTLLAPDQPLQLTAQFSANARGAGDGLLGQYFADYNYENPLPLRPTATRVDTLIDFDWQDESPLIDIGKDNYAVRWSGR